MKSILFKNDYDKKSSWVNMHSCKYISAEREGIDLHFIDNTTYKVVSIEYMESAQVSDKAVLDAIVDRIWSSSDDAIVDIDKIIEHLQKEGK